MARLLLATTVFLWWWGASPPARAQAQPEGTAAAPKRQWDYRSDAEIRASRGYG